MRYKSLLFCLFMVMLLLVGNIIYGQKKYALKYKPLADSLSGVYSIPSQLILAIAIIESGGGNTRTAKLLNNHFGIVGKNNLLKLKGIKTKYKQYADVRASYIDFCELMRRKNFYTKLKHEKKLPKWVEAIAKAGYSEYPEKWKKEINISIKSIESLY